MGEPASPIQAALVSPALAVRVGLRALLPAGRAGEHPVEVVWEAAGLAGREPLPLDVDVLVITADGLSLPGLEAALDGREGRLAVLLLADDPGLLRGLRDLPLRAWGALPLDAGPDELAAAIQALAQGLVAGAPDLLGALLDRTYIAAPESAEGVNEALTEREGQVLQLLAQGLPNKQIALALKISEHTVKFHISSIYAKLGATNRTEAVRFGVQRGLVLL